MIKVEWIISLVTYTIDKIRIQKYIHDFMVNNFYKDIKEIQWGKRKNFQQMLLEKLDILMGNVMNLDSLLQTTPE